MKKILSICLVLMLASMSVMAEDVISSKDNPKFLYVLSATSGSFENDTVTLKGIPLVIYFSDRPDRIAGHMSLEEFVKMWNKSADRRKIDPPNATISIYNKDVDKDVVVEISNPRLEKNILTFRARLLNGSLPQLFGVSSLFIDDAPAEAMGTIYKPTA